MFTLYFLKWNIKLWFWILVLYILTETQTPHAQPALPSGRDLVHVETQTTRDDSQQQEPEEKEEEGFDSSDEEHDDDSDSDWGPDQYSSSDESSDESCVSENM